MPKPAPSMNSTNRKLRSRNFLLKIFLPWACIGFIGYVIFEKSQRLVAPKSEEKIENLTQNLEPNKQKPGVIKIIILKDMTLRLDTYNIPNKNINNLELKEIGRSMISPNNIEYNYPELEIHIDTFENLKKKIKFVKNENALQKYDKLLEKQKKYKKEYIGNKKLEPKAEELIKERDNELLEIIKLTKEKLEQNKLKPKKEKKEKKRTQKDLSKLLKTFTNKEIVNFNEEIWFKTGEIKFDRFKKEEQ